MDTMEKMFQFVINQRNILLMIWDKEDGWCVVSRQSDVVKELDKKNATLGSLADWVKEEDVYSFNLFVSQIEKACISTEKETNITEEDSKSSVQVRILNKYGIYVFQNVECWFERMSGHIERIFVVITPLEQKEIHRIEIAQKFTSDRAPMIIHHQAEQLINRNPDKKFAVLQFDVPGFKMINERYGEEGAEKLLKFFSDSLKVICNQFQVFSRLTADVFMIITPYTDEKSIYDFIAMLDKTLLGYEDMEYRLVYGVCYIGDLSAGLRRYGDSAAIARQKVKENALTHIAFFSGDMRKEMELNKSIEYRMEKAMDNGEFRMFLQPKFSIANGGIVGAEALVRWITLEGKIIPPMDFVPLFEKNGFIIKMDAYMWEQACVKLRNWIDEGKKIIPISVNVSRKHLKDDNFVKVLNELVKKYNIPKKYLEIEITETLEGQYSEQGIKALKESGFRLLMDDFGSGYSSLNTLKDTRFDVIKIDRGFLQGFIDTERGQKIVEHTIQMTRDIGLDIVAEGVETKAQAEFLSQCGCDVAQGFYYAKPMNVTEFENKYL